MAAQAEEQKQEEEEKEQVKKLACSYLGISFSVFLALLPDYSITLVSKLQSQVEELKTRLLFAEEQLKQMKSRRKEDSKANARVVEIFASHRNAWQSEEKRLLLQIDSTNQDIVHLTSKFSDYENLQSQSQARIYDLERELRERDELLSFMSRRVEFQDEYPDQEDKLEERVLDEDALGVGVGGGSESREWFQKDTPEECEDQNVNAACVSVLCGHQCHHPHHLPHANGFNSEFLASASKFWAERATPWQDVQYESMESLYQMKHFVPRRESPWKVDGESTGVPSKLKLLEKELINLENIGKSDLLKVPSLMRKQAKRYQALAGKIDDLCSRMQASDPCEPTLSPEFRTQRQTEFLIEAFRLQQRASETGQKLTDLQAETVKSYCRDEVGNQAKMTTRRCLDSIRNNFKEIQRNLEIWLARIIGDLEGILARDGSSRLNEYYISHYPFVQ